MTHRTAPRFVAPLLLLSALLLSAPTAAQSPATPGYARDEVRGVIEMQRAAWNAKDLKGFCAHYADNAAFLSPSGLSHGRAKILARYTKRYVEEKGDMGRLTFDVIEMRTAPDQKFATVALRWKLRFSKKMKDGKQEASGLSLIALEKRAAGWVIVQDASM